MKAALTVLATVTLISFGPSCAKHSWKDTQVLHEKYQDHGHAGGDAHGKADDHGTAKPAAGHEEKKPH